MCSLCSLNIFLQCFSTYKKDLNFSLRSFLIISSKRILRSILNQNLDLAKCSVDNKYCTIEDVWAAMNVVCDDDHGEKKKALKVETQTEESSQSFFSIERTLATRACGNEELILMHFLINSFSYIAKHNIIIFHLNKIDPTRSMQTSFFRPAGKHHEASFKEPHHSFDHTKSHRPFD